MAFNRRGFLQLLGAGVASLALPDTDGWRFLTQETRTFSGMEAFRMPTITDLETLTKCVTARMSQLQMETSRRPFLLGLEADGYQMGSAVAGHVLTDQACVHMVVPDYRQSQADLLARYVDPLGTALFERVSDRHAAVFGALPVPNQDWLCARVTDPRSGITVRGLQGYDHARRAPIMRFDVLYGRAEGLAHAA